MLCAPSARVRVLDDRPADPNAAFVLYWMTMARRPGWNWALQHALAWSQELGKPLLVLEALRCDYPWASDRLHRFVLDGMRDNARAFADGPVRYYPYLETQRGAGKDLLAALARHAALVVADDFPAFMLPRMTETAVARAGRRFESIDSNGIYPMRATGIVFPTAYAFRRHLQRELRGHLPSFPLADPIAHAKPAAKLRLPKAISERWPIASQAALGGDLSKLPIDHAVGAVEMPGGHIAAKKALAEFVSKRLEHYPNDRNQPGREGTSRISPYLHFGHISAHEIVEAIAKRERWSEDKLDDKANGKRTGWWGMSEAAEAFLDQLVTWRELGYNFCAHRGDTADYASLPTWALATLEKHAGDPRPHMYSVDALEAAATHDPLWNAAMTQLKREGWFHSYLRMLWGKKILEWSASPLEAHAAMIRLMDRWSLDGRDPNAYSGYAWTLGRYDRPWGPERPIFGTVRYMSSENTARKFDVRGYLARYSPQDALF